MLRGGGHYLPYAYQPSAHVYQHDSLHSAYFYQPYDSTTPPDNCYHCYHKKRRPRGRRHRNKASWLRLTEEQQRVGCCSTGRQSGFCSYPGKQTGVS